MWRAPCRYHHWWPPRATVEATNHLDARTAAAVQARVLPRAAEQTLGGLRQSLKRAVLSLAPDAQEQVRLRKVDDRRVRIRTTGVGTSELWALLPDGGAASLIAAVTALARRVEPGDGRTSDQRQADALVQLGLDALAGKPSARLPTEQRVRPAVQVTVSLSTLLGLDEQPGELDGVGPISAALARRIAHDPTGTWRRLITDQRGRLVDYGRTTYRPPADLADHVISRDRTCRFPHCTRAARRCDLDHRIRWSDGGTTTEANLHALCPRHHRAKDEAGWRIRPTGHGHVGWTSPTGHEYATPAATYPIDTTAVDLPVHTTADPDPPPF